MLVITFYSSLEESTTPPFHHQNFGLGYRKFLGYALKINVFGSLEKHKKMKNSISSLQTVSCTANCVGNT